MSYSKILTVALTILFLSGTVFADWHTLDQNAAEDANLKIKVLESSDDGVKLELTVPGYHLHPLKMKVDGKLVYKIHIPGASYLMEKGFPLVPKLGTLVKIDEARAPRLVVESVEEEESKLEGPIVPSRGHFTRDIKPETVAFEFGPIYNENTFYVDSKKQFSIGKPFIFRNVRGVRLQVFPVSVNHVTMKMKVVKKAVISIKYDGVGAMNVMTTRVASSPAFSEIYSSTFINSGAKSSAMPPEEHKKLVVVVPSEYKDLGSISDWIAFKEARGFTVTKIVTTASQSADNIKSLLQKEYNANNLGYVVLFGDIDTMPTLKGKYERAYSDRIYVRLAGNDNYGDAFISRISGNASQITVQLKKIMKYEGNAKPGKWNVGVMCIASAEGNPKDYTRASWLINGGGKGQKVPTQGKGLKGVGYDRVFEVYDWGATPGQVADAIGKGTGIICYIGHGSTTAWSTSRFNNSHIKQLSNGEMLPVIWSVACVNGKFQVRECFAEAWLRQEGGGAVAVEAASTNEAWVPPCDKQSGTVNAYINALHKTFGALEMYGCIKALETWGDTDKSQGNQLAEQCILFGDCTMVVHYPKK